MIPAAAEPRSDGEPRMKVSEANETSAINVENPQEAETVTNSSCDQNDKWSSVSSRSCSSHERSFSSADDVKNAPFILSVFFCSRFFIFLLLSLCGYGFLSIISI